MDTKTKQYRERFDIVFSPKERQTLELLAESRDLTLSGWLKYAINRAGKRLPKASDSSTPVLM